MLQQNRSRARKKAERKRRGKGEKKEEERKRKKKGRRKKEKKYEVVDEEVCNMKARKAFPLLGSAPIVEEKEVQYSLCESMASSAGEKSSFFSFSFAPKKERLFFSPFFLCRPKQRASE